MGGEYASVTGPKGPTEQMGSEAEFEKGMKVSLWGNSIGEESHVGNDSGNVGSGKGKKVRFPNKLLKDFVTH